MPFANSDKANVYKLILEGQIDQRPLELYDLSAEALDFLHCLLNSDPNLRYDAHRAL
jgi:hypothetical protein